MPNANRSASRALPLSVEAPKVSTRRTIAVTLRRWRWEFLMAAAWIALLFVAQYTARTPQLLAGSLVAFAVIGALDYLKGVRIAAREIEREIAAEVALSVSVPRFTPPDVEKHLYALRLRIAAAIRAHGSHLREARHG